MVNIKEYINNVAKIIKNKFFMFCLILMVTILAFYLISNTGTQGNGKKENGIDLEIKKTISNSFISSLKAGMKEQSECIKESNDFLSTSSTFDDIIAIYKYGDAEYYIIKINGIAQTKGERENISVFYAARITAENIEFERVTPFYHFSLNETETGDFYIVNMPDLTYVMGVLADEKYGFFHNENHIYSNKEGCIGLILKEKKPKIKIKLLNEIPQ